MRVVNRERLDWLVQQACKEFEGVEFLRSVDGLKEAHNQTYTVYLRINNQERQIPVSFLTLEDQDDAEAIEIIRATIEQVGP